MPPATSRCPRWPLTVPTWTVGRCVVEQARAVGAVEAGHLDRIAKRRGGAMGFDVRDGLRSDAGHLLRCDDHIGSGPATLGAV